MGSKTGWNAKCYRPYRPHLSFTAGPHPTMAPRPNEKMDLTAPFFWQIDQFFLLGPMLNSHLTK
jgi:hypothetical protein